VCCSPPNRACFDPKPRTRRRPRAPFLPAPPPQSGGALFLFPTSFPAGTPLGAGPQRRAFSLPRFWHFTKPSRVPLHPARLFGVAVFLFHLLILSCVAVAFTVPWPPLSPTPLCTLLLFVRVFFGPPPTCFVPGQFLGPCVVAGSPREHILLSHALLFVVD